MIYRVPQTLAPGQPVFPEGLQPDRNGLVALGGVLEPDVVLEAYGKGIFPWTGKPPIPWYSPDPRLVLRPNELRVSRSLRKTLRSGRFGTRFDTAFAQVMLGCANTPRPGQPGTWITPSMRKVYGALHARGFAHSVETYLGEELVGGLYGLALGRAFFGESMFARVSDASKVALHALCERLAAWEFAFVDCQQVTAHLVRLGAFAMPRVAYLRELDLARRSSGRVGVLPCHW